MPLEKPKRSIRGAGAPVKPPPKPDKTGSMYADKPQSWPDEVVGDFGKPEPPPEQRHAPVSPFERWSQLTSLYRARALCKEFACLEAMTNQIKAYEGVATGDMGRAS